MPSVHLPTCCSLLSCYCMIRQQPSNRCKRGSRFCHYYLMQMDKKFLVSHAVDGIILLLLLWFAFDYQTVLNQERVDAQFELSAFLFGVRDKSTQAPRNIDSFNELLSIFVGISNAYYLIPERTIGTYMHYTYSGTNFTPRAPVVEVTFQGARQGHAADLEDTVWSFDVKESDLLGVAVQSYDHFYNLCGSGKLGKLHEVLCHAFSTNGSLDRLDRIRLSFSLYSLRRSSMGDVVPTQWNAEALFEIYGYGPVVTMTTSLSFVEERSPQRVPIMISLAMIPLLLLGLAVRTRALPQLGGCITKLNIFRKKRHRELLSANNSTARGEGMALLVFCTDLIVLFFSILSLVAQFSQTTDETMEHNVTVLLGLAVFARSTKLISVLKWSSGLRVVVEGFVTAADQLAMYVVAVFPILFGYSICAFIVYGGFGSRFSTVPYSLVTLICTALGDNLIDTFVGMDQGAYAVQMVFTRIFFCSFLAFFICNVLNVAFSIIQDSYNQAVRVNSDSTGRNSHRCSIAATLSRKELLEMLSKFRS
uniref:Ion transport domain-containing protein n=1 Tax=Trypanosoma congolense (strain IL3000) TaxID=1068625 RepID=G0UPE9_TRYCI|nr:conserved hypothetical protein [Trypanosoma congolense IL3000]